MRHVFGVVIVRGAGAVAVGHGLDRGGQREDVIVVLGQQRGIESRSEVGIAAARGDIDRQSGCGHLADDQIRQVGRCERARGEHGVARAQIGGEYHLAVGRGGIGKQRCGGVGQSRLHGVVAAGVCGGGAHHHRAGLAHGGNRSERHRRVGDGRIDHGAFERGVGRDRIDLGRAATAASAGAEAQCQGGCDGQ